MAERYKEKRPKLSIPYYPTKDSEGVPFDINTLQEKAVAEYANIPLPQVHEFDVFTFWALLHDSVVYNRSQTKEGREWLKNAWRLTRTSPDEEKLRKKVKRGG